VGGGAGPPLSGGRRARGARGELSTSDAVLDSGLAPRAAAHNLRPMLWSHDLHPQRRAALRAEARALVTALLRRPHSRGVVALPIPCVLIPIPRRVRLVRGEGRGVSD
jgi:hypothetical protein